MALVFLADHTQPSLVVGTQHLADGPGDTHGQCGPMKGPERGTTATF